MTTLHALSAIMPTHTAIFQAATKTLQPSTLNLKPSPRPIPGSRAKYIIIQSIAMELAILFHESISHSDAINRKDRQPLSAGYYWLNTDGSVTTDVLESTSLQLKPRPQDAQIIENTLHLLRLTPSVP